MGAGKGVWQCWSNPAVPPRGSTVTGAIRQASQVRDALVARYDLARTRPSDAVPAAQAQDAPKVASVPHPPTAIAAPLDLANFIGATAAPAASASAPPMQTAAATPPVRGTAGMTTAFAAASQPTPTAAQANRIFHGLFQDTARAAPVAATVSQLWTTPNVLPETSGTPVQPQPQPRRDLRGLFSDSGEGA